MSGPILILKSKLLVTAITNHDNQAYHDDNHDDGHDDNHDDNYDGDDDDDDDDDHDYDHDDHEEEDWPWYYRVNNCPPITNHEDPTGPGCLSLIIQTQTQMHTEKENMNTWKRYADCLSLLFNIKDNQIRALFNHDTSDILSFPTTYITPDWPIEPVKWLLNYVWQK